MCIENIILLLYVVAVFPYVMACMFFGYCSSFLIDRRESKKMMYDNNISLHTRWWRRRRRCWRLLHRTHSLTLARTDACFFIHIFFVLIMTRKPFSDQQIVSVIFTLIRSSIIFIPSSIFCLSQQRTESRSRRALASNDSTRSQSPKNYTSCAHRPTV